MPWITIWTLAKGLNAEKCVGGKTVCTLEDGLISKDTTKIHLFSFWDSSPLCITGYFTQLVETMQCFWFGFHFHGSGDVWAPSTSGPRKEVCSPAPNPPLHYSSEISHGENEKQERCSIDKTVKWRATEKYANKNSRTSAQIALVLLQCSDYYKLCASSVENQLFMIHQWGPLLSVWILLNQNSANKYMAVRGLTDKTLTAY